MYNAQLGMNKRGKEEEVGRGIIRKEEGVRTERGRPGF